LTKEGHLTIVIAAAQPTFRIVLLIAVGVGMIGVGLFAALRPEKSVEPDGKRLMVVIGIVLVVVGIGLSVSSFVSIA
jgi:hypothetical protein